ncbi:MAG: hypothetical protein H0X51_06065 [Parachlamydiaceae bacterium]|nr:hypothetical protein [Parachlamydiaceae bacterium]
MQILTVCGSRFSNSEIGRAINARLSPTAQKVILAVFVACTMTGALLFLGLSAKLSLMSGIGAGGLSLRFSSNPAKPLNRSPEIIHL